MIPSSGRRKAAGTTIGSEIRTALAAMPLPLVRRVDILESNVHALRHLPDQVSSMAAGMAALRSDVNSIRDTLTTVCGALSDGRGIINVRAEIAAGDQETRRQMRILHEEVISRIAMLQEGRPAGICTVRAGTTIPVDT